MCRWVGEFIIILMSQQFNKRPLFPCCHFRVNTFCKWSSHCSRWRDSPAQNCGAEFHSIGGESDWRRDADWSGYKIRKEGGCCCRGMEGQNGVAPGPLHWLDKVGHDSGKTCRCDPGQKEWESMGMARQTVEMLVDTLQAERHPVDCLIPMLSRQVENIQRT